MTILPVRGQIYRVEINEEHGPKPFVVVSNNQRNKRLSSVLAARVTTTEKSNIPTAVPLTSGQDPLVGYVLADDIVEIWKYELEQSTYLGALSPRTVIELNGALAQALGIP